MRVELLRALHEHRTIGDVLVERWEKYWMPQGEYACLDPDIREEWQAVKLSNQIHQQKSAEFERLKERVWN